MAYTTEELRDAISKLERALRSGVRTVEFADRTATYNSPDEIRGSIQYFRDQLVETTAARPKQSFGVASKGL